MPLLISKIIYISDHESFYHHHEFNLAKPEYFEFIGGKQVSLIPESSVMDDTIGPSVDFPLFNEHQLTFIPLNLPHNGIFYLKQRPNFTLTQIISDTEGIYVDVVTSGNRLLWYFYNNTNSEQVPLYLKEGPDTENFAMQISKNCADIKIRREIVNRVLIKINAKGVIVPPMQPESSLVTMLGPITLKEIQLLIKGKKKRSIQKLLKKYNIQNIDKKGREHLYDPRDIVNLATQEGSALNITELIKFKFNDLKMSKSQDIGQPRPLKLADIGTVSYQRVKEQIRIALYSHKNRPLYEEAVHIGTIKYLEVKKSHPDEKENFYISAATNAARDFLRAEEKLKRSPLDRDLDSE